MSPMSRLIQGNAVTRHRVLAVLALLLMPRAAVAHGGGFELILPAWFLGGFLLLWVMAGWNARARLKWLTTLAVVLFAGFGGIVADSSSDGSWPADVAEKWILGTVVVPLLVLAVIKAVTSRSNSRPRA
jgi:hypothetical protein